MAFSLIELLVVIGVIAIIAAIGIGNFVGIRNSAMESAIESQEQTINTLYRSLKASSTNMPTTQSGILSFLATNSVSTMTPPTTLDGPGGVATLTFDPILERFDYVSSEDAGNLITADDSGGSSGSNIVYSGISTRSDYYADRGAGLFYPESWFETAEPAVEGGPAVNYAPAPGGHQFEAFQVSVAVDGTATVTTASGQIYTLDPKTKAPVEYNNGYEIYWNDADGGVKVSSVVNRSAAVSSLPQ